ncbi:DUF2867 domain-containing protein [Actinomadura sp. HBU206391]|uniref:DUF2867 domain-containing protein n=1 Tax=Actinomadura sp. HBU206391 TaxID=2731692 RepID=UPI002905EC6F|nr:DUF2867 domain-containing protein [Actinomadura sp. HBU206391]
MSAQTGVVEGNARRSRCLVTGATGYVGSRLVPELLAAGHPVRCMSRSAARLREFPWIDEVEAVAADAQDAPAMRRALKGVDVAFYLIHSLRGGGEFERADRQAAQAFAAAAKIAGVRRIVYLGGLGPSAQDELSAHLRSRSEVAQILLNSGVPTIVLRAAVIVGAGSTSFEMLRHLTERLPIMVAPRWVATRVQPIAIPDVLRYLVGCAGLPHELNRTFDIGGPDVLTYLEMMRRYAAVAGLHRRFILLVPVLTPRLSSLWIGLVTPVPTALARPLVGSLYHEVVCREHDIADHLPAVSPGLIGFDQGVRLALRWVRDIRLADCAPEEQRTASDPLPTDPRWTGGALYEDVRERAVSTSPKALWRLVSEIPGWFEGRPASIGQPPRRGLLGAVSAGLGGVVRKAGAALRPWRVDDVEPGRRLRIRAGAPLLPGVVWLELGVRSGTVPTVYTQRAMFHPHGLIGHLCWWVARPCSRAVLAGLERGVTTAANMERRPVTDHPRDITTLTGSRSPQ